MDQKHRLGAYAIFAGFCLFVLLVLGLVKWLG
jgi:hypothetical protein